jgi:transposase
MAAKAIRMEQLKQVLQLKQNGFSIKAIARTTGIARNTIKKYLSRMDTGNAVSNKEIALRAFDTDTTDLKGERYNCLLGHLRYAETQLNKTGVTRQLLWLEYKEQNPGGYNYSQYCYHFNEFLRHKEVVMHLEHAAGEKIMIDFAGKHLSYVDSSSGELGKGLTVNQRVVGSSPTGKIEMSRPATYLANPFLDRKG